MATGLRHTEEVEDHGIDLAPMLDFVLNLLIFFIITTSFVKETGVQVTRPEAVTGVQYEKGNLHIAVRENGDVWMDRKQIPIGQLRGAIERLHIERPDDTVVIIGDKMAPAGMIAQVMDEVKKGGINDIALAAAPPAG
jgi:biopolymer transport protein ExbD